MHEFIYMKTFTETNSNRIYISGERITYIKKRKLFELGLTPNLGVGGGTMPGPPAA